MIELTKYMAFNFKTVFSSLKTAAHEQLTKVVGIDVGSSSVKLVELEMREDIIALSTYGELQLGPYGDAGMGNIVKLPLSKRIEAIIDVMRESNVSAKNAVLSLPLSESFVTVMSLATKPGEDISPRVNVEARKYIPVPISDVALEWAEIEQDKPKEALAREILIAAIQNDALSDMKVILDAINMTSRPSEIELFSTLRAVTKESDSSLAIIDVGASMTKLYIAESGSLRRIHRVQGGGASATLALSKELQLSFEDAENLKRNYVPNSEHGPLIKKIMSSAFERSFQEFKRVISQYEMRSGKPVARIALTGGSALFPDLRPFASYAFDTEVETTNPFAKVAYPAFMEDTLKEISPIFTVALGAALRSFEL